MKNTEITPRKAVIDRLTIVGTSHIAKQSLKEVEETVERIKPEIIALELDKGRLIALFNENEQKERAGVIIKKIGFKGYMIAKFGEFIEKQMGKMVGVKPGSEMKLGARLAKKTGAKIALVDQDITITMQRLSKGISWKEKWNFFIDIITGPFTAKKQMKEMKIDLSKVPDDTVIEILMEKMKERYPNLYRVLITERNQVIAKNLHKILIENPEAKVVAILGAGHRKEVLKIIAQKEEN